jgi:hypothetical protein
MDRDVTFSREKLHFVLRQILAVDILGNPVYQAGDRVEEGFEKRATLEFLTWFVDQAIPEGLDVPYTYSDLENDYPLDAARRISGGKGWAAPLLRHDGTGEKTVFVDFRNKK